MTTAALGFLFKLGSVPASLLRASSLSAELPSRKCTVANSIAPFLRSRLVGAEPVTGFVGWATFVAFGVGAGAFVGATVGVGVGVGVATAKTVGVGKGAGPTGFVGAIVGTIGTFVTTGVGVFVGFWLAIKFCKIESTEGLPVGVTTGVTGGVIVGVASTSNAVGVAGATVVGAFVGANVGVGAAVTGCGLAVPTPLLRIARFCLSIPSTILCTSKVEAISAPSSMMLVFSKLRVILSVHTVLPLWTLMA